MGSLLMFGSMARSRISRRKKSIEHDPAIHQAHRDYLFMRDYTGLCAVFVVLYGAAGMFFIPSMKVGLSYLMVLAAPFVLVRQAASNIGVLL